MYATTAGRAVRRHLCRARYADLDSQQIHGAADAGSTVCMHVALNQARAATANGDVAGCVAADIGNAASVQRDVAAGGQHDFAAFRQMD